MKPNDKKMTSTEFFHINYGECWKEAKEIIGKTYTYDTASTLQHNLYKERFKKYFTQDSK